MPDYKTCAECGHSFGKHNETYKCCQWTLEYESTGKGWANIENPVCKCTGFKAELKEIIMDKNKIPHSDDICKCGHRFGNHGAGIGIHPCYNSHTGYGTSDSGFPPCTCTGFVLASSASDIQVAKPPCKECGHEYIRHCLDKYGKVLTESGCLAIVGDQHNTNAAYTYDKWCSCKAYVDPTPDVLDVDANSVYDPKDKVDNPNIQNLPKLSMEMMPPLPEWMNAAALPYTSFVMESKPSTPYWSNSQFKIQAKATEAETQAAENYLYNRYYIKETKINGIRIETMMAEYANQISIDLKYNLDKLVAERTAFELKRQHKKDCIPSFRKNDRKFRSN